MAKTRPDSRSYALIHPDIGKWGGYAVLQSTVAWVCCKNIDKRTYISSKINYTFYLYTAKIRPDSRLYVLIHPDMGNGEGNLCVNRL